MDTVLGLGENKKRKKNSQQRKSKGENRQHDETRLNGNERQTIGANNINNINSVCLKAQKLLSLKNQHEFVKIKN